MDWSINMGKLIKMLLGIPSEVPKTKKFQITPKMVNSNVVRMDMTSFRNSSVVQDQAKAARTSVN
ncbi:conserved hypothetical protein [Vibrio crassostreae]|nr:hypothetical protein VCHA37P193_350036 [Vibrio chagasii]CAK2025640.1 conserved hypothetical protein [Vibrio crassostreae]CAK2028049.1 conserved hypothetical protein [Vibrio crassostreae]CAK2038716.1 conserved hypothetical protein [Vibrio crassostreae]CAK2896611.1 conserved hypothetical protein [Vibrio crassostreae]